MVVAGCGVAPQPESAKTVAAFEVSLPTEQDRTEFLSVLRRVAKAEGLHVDSASQQELKRMAEAIPESKMTIHAAVWRGTNDDELEASILDQPDHLGQAWIMFSKGEDPALATRFRDRAMAEILLRWPGTLSLPIMPTGAVPLHRDLIRTPTGYVIDPSAAPKYELENAGDHRS
jgi:hypothetical protein